MKVSSPPEVPSVSRTGLGMSSIGAHVGVSGDLRDAERQGRQDYALTPDPDAPPGATGRSRPSARGRPFSPRSFTTASRSWMPR